MSAIDYMRSLDVQAFVTAAGRFKVWILVRRSNVAAKDHIGKPGFSPKRLDCKAKTADKNAQLGILGEKKTAGLVVDPTIPGMETAFEKSTKHSNAVRIWRESFQNMCYFPQPGDQPRTYYPQGKLYTVQSDQKHPRYGCVMFSSGSLVSAGSYVHSDYDLYAIVPEDDPTTNVRVKEKRLGMSHSRGREFFDIQHFLNRTMGVAMVLHGDQEKYSDDTDDKVDVFWPDGRPPTEAYGASQIRSLYETTFKGRQMFGPGAKPQPYFGQWEQV
jgi:hypothetical protein